MLSSLHIMTYLYNIMYTYWALLCNQSSIGKMGHFNLLLCFSGNLCCRMGLVGGVKKAIPFMSLIEWTSILGVYGTIDKPAIDFHQYLLKIISTLGFHDFFERLSLSLLSHTSWWQRTNKKYRSLSNKNSCMTLLEILQLSHTCTCTSNHTHKN